MRAIRDYQGPLKEHEVTIFVRRGGPNYQEGLRVMGEVGKLGAVFSLLWSTVVPVVGPVSRRPPSSLLDLCLGLLCSFYLCSALFHPSSPEPQDGQESILGSATASLGSCGRPHVWQALGSMSCEGEHGVRAGGTHVLEGQMESTVLSSLGCTETAHLS